MVIVIIIIIILPPSFVHKRLRVVFSVGLTPMTEPIEIAMFEIFVASFLKGVCMSSRGYYGR